MTETLDTGAEPRPAEATHHSHAQSGCLCPARCAPAVPRAAAELPGQISAGERVRIWSAAMILAGLQPRAGLVAPAHVPLTPSEATAPAISTRQVPTGLVRSAEEPATKMRRVIGRAIKMRAIPAGFLMEQPPAA